MGPPLNCTITLMFAFGSMPSRSGESFGCFVSLSSEGVRAACWMASLGAAAGCCSPTCGRFCAGSVVLEVDPQTLRKRSRMLWDGVGAVCGSCAGESAERIAAISPEGALEFKELYPK